MMNHHFLDPSNVKRLFFVVLLMENDLAYKQRSIFIVYIRLSIFEQTNEFLVVNSIFETSKFDFKLYT